MATDPIQIANMNTGSQIGLNDALNIEHAISPINSQPITAPSNPTAGWFIYTDTADGKLKAKASTGTVVTLGTP